MFFGAISRLDSGLFLGVHVVTAFGDGNVAIRRSVSGVECFDRVPR